MEKIDLSLNSKQILEAYDKVVRGDSSTTYVVYTVDKNLLLVVDETGNGSLDEFVEHFTDGHIQFGLARVTVPGSDVSKVLLLGWCPDNSPLKLRLSFATNFAEVSKVLSGYHIQITARDQDDLDTEEFLKRVGAAAGARYSLNTGSNIRPNDRPAPKTAPKPFVTKSAPTPAASSSTPSYVPKSTGKPIAPVAPKPALPKPKVFGAPAPTSKSSNDDDDWAGEKEIEARDFSQKPLEDVPSSYKPTKVNIDELRKQKSDTISSQPKPNNLNSNDSKDETDAKPLSERLKSYESSSPSDGRLTSLPKPKVSHSVASRFTPASESSGSGPSFGSKPNFGAPSYSNKDKVVGGLSKNFGSEGGKTPAQLWAEKRGQYKSVPSDSEPVKSGELEEKFSKASIQPEAEEEEEEPEVEEEEKEPEPTPSLPVRSLPPPPAPVAVSAPEPEEEEEEPEAEEEEPEAAPSLPVRSLPPPPAPAAVSEPVAEAKSSKPSAIAEYDYEKEEDDELEFKEGDLIVEIDFIDDDWCSGKHSVSGLVGLFPATYVVLKEGSDSKPIFSNAAASAPATAEPEPEAAAPAAAEKKITAVADYDYERDEDNEISFKEGDLIIDIEFFDDDWWLGTHEKTGEKGVFPANHVKLNE